MKIEWTRLTVLKAIHATNEITLTQVKEDSWHVEIRGPQGGVHVTLAHDEEEAIDTVSKYFEGE